LIIALSAISLDAQDLKIAVIRVSFQTDASLATTGDGQFVLHDTVALDCPDWTLDPPPHDATYFSDHLRAANNYWRKVSENHQGVDLANSAIFPAGDTASYRLPHDMLYYHPYNQDYDETAKLFELSRDAIQLADADIAFDGYTTVIIVHAGMGGDFAFALDPTPGNIPSAFLSTTDFASYGTLQTDEGPLADLIIIPESQNFLQYKETRSLFADSSDPCFYQVGLNGTLALMLGFELGLPPLYDTETGTSLVGGFALMDQGSNNFHGIAPAYPSPYSRVSQGWITAVNHGIGDTVQVAVNDPPVRIDISADEYYLIENRQRNLQQPAELPEWIDTSGYDTVSVVLANSGVVLDVDEQHAGLPGNGIYIWHIDESAWNSTDNPNGGSIQLVDFVEADGAQDMGHTTQLLFADYLETGWWFDPWFAGNAGWFHLNRQQTVTPDSLLSFTPTTFPATNANDGTPSHLQLGNISRNGSVMSFTVGSDRLVATGNSDTFIGWGADRAGFYSLNADSSELLYASFADGNLLTTPAAITAEQIFSESIDNNLTYRYPWVATQRANGLRFINIETGITHFNTLVDSIRELSVNGTLVTYFAKQSGANVLVNWDTNAGTSSVQTLPSPAQARFQTNAGFTPFYGTETLPYPSGVAQVADYSGLIPVPAQLDVLSWSTATASLHISHLPEDLSDELGVARPEYILPCDADEDGVYELALFYADQIQVITQQGVAWNGNPFATEPFFGNPLIFPLLNGELGIFLRQADAYSIYSPSGKLLDSGVLPAVSAPVRNSLGLSHGQILLRSGALLLHFDNAYTGLLDPYWIDPQGSSRGDRVTIVQPGSATIPQGLKNESAYNYPNPVKGPRTTIRAWIGSADTWRIEIFSLDGHQIKYVDQPVEQQQAYNEWDWDASQVSNGVYLAQVSAGGQAEIIKIAVIR